MKFKTLVWYGYGMSIYFDSDTDSYTILYDDDELIGSDLTAMEVKLFYNGVVNMINATTPHHNQRSFRPGIGG